MNAETGDVDIETIDIQLNGEVWSLEQKATLLGLLSSLGKDPRTVAVERNGSIVRRPDYGDCHLQAGDRVEIVHFVQGG